MYLTGAEANTIRKLLGVPGTPSGTAADEAKIVTDLLIPQGTSAPRKV